MIGYESKFFNYKLSDFKMYGFLFFLGISWWVFTCTMITMVTNHGDHCAIKKKFPGMADLLVIALPHILMSLIRFIFRMLFYIKYVTKIIVYSHTSSFLFLK